MEMVLEFNLLGALRILKEMKIKPNFSELERQFGVDRHTIKKYYDNDGKIRKEKEHRIYSSRLCCFNVRYGIYVRCYERT